ncbi:nuclear transport factor 2 family protein [Polymorphobacter sp. PAMC 29334]|uniref:nuclear transport factor 2 family protein n=1 Tax=Polymorphobacter sp. PAMC 29334 TaxID=2862331 RepID=UPI001D0041EB|nr:nuclear transport factor 2 family protein [Polymorphobacter sp. PAMC 29334]
MADDKAEIIEALNLYAFALDARQWDLFDRIFTDDIIMDLGPAAVAWKNRAEFKQGFKNFHETLDNHQHTMMGHLVQVDGDTAKAFCYGNWLLVRDAAEGGPSWMGTGWYDDELVRTNGRWMINKRVCRLLSWTGNPRVPEPNGDQSPDMNMNSLFRSSDAGEVGFLKAIRSA